MRPEAGEAANWSHVVDAGPTRASKDPGHGARLGAFAVPLVRYFRRKGAPADLAQDCAQEVFLRLAGANEATVENAEAYLFTIAASVEKPCPPYPSNA